MARDAIRREVLTEDLLALPRQVEKLAAHTDARFAEMGFALAQLANRMDQLAAQVGTLAGAQERMGGEVSRVVGAEYEA